MRSYYRVTFSLSAACLASCASTSFAPPHVNLSSKSEIVSQLGGDSRPLTNSDGSCRSQIRQVGAELTENDTSARILINNFILAYRCAAHEAADGRQGFEVPGILLAAGTVTAAAFGAGSDVAIAGGAGSALLATGKNYYSPQQKAQFYDRALDALLCIKSEAVGVMPFDTRQGGENYSNKSNQRIPVSANQRYYALVTTALFSVERILSQRLSTAGQFDPAGLIAEIEAVKSKVEAAETKKLNQTGASDSQPASQPETDTPDSKTTGPDGSADPSAPLIINLKDGVEGIGDQRNEQGVDGDGETTAAEMPKLFEQADSSTSSKYFNLDLDLLQPKLQQCVIRAKL